MGIWEDFMGALGALMAPLYWAVSGTVVAFHTLFSGFLDSGWSWALAIICLTIVIRTLLIPLFVRQIRSSRNMQLLGPRTKELQDKFGHDRERLGQETMKMYKEEGVNPMASCLPLFLQMPIFIALYQVLWSASQGNAIGVLTTAQAQSLQSATIFGAKLSGIFWPMTSFGPTQVLTSILIVAMTGVLFVTQLQLMRKNMPPEAMTGQMAQQQKMMLYIFPVMYLFMGVSIPVGVLLYWLVSNLWTMGQQYILIHNNPAPNTPAYLDWEERMRAKGKDPAEIAAKRAGKPKARPTAQTGDSTTIARQTRKGGPATTKPAEGSETTPEASEASTTEERQVVRRQQPQRKPRAVRKQNPTRSPGEPSEA
ncbi:MAG: membrane protein insertase YidC [Micropruina sp.]|nr:membrane protein insertase YidC [Micropruina sp.]